MELCFVVGGEVVDFVGQSGVVECVVLTAAMLDGAIKVF